MALNRLVTEGILNKIPKKGCYIPNLNRDDATAAFQARKLIEGAAAKDAAKFTSSQELKKLTKLLDKGEKAIENKDYRLFAEMDEEFHHGLVKLSKNEYIYRTWRLVYTRTSIYTRFFDSLYFNVETLMSEKLLKSTLSTLSGIYHDLGVHGILYNPMELKYCDHCGLAAACADYGAGIRRWHPARGDGR